MDAFDDLVAAMDTAMVVVTVAAAAERNGCLVGFHCQCSIDPPRYAVWLSKANRTYELAARATHLAVHVLGDDQHELAERFGGQTGDEVDKLAGCDWTPGPSGVPLLDAAPGRFVGRIVERVTDDGDHVCVVIEPVGAAGAAPAHVLRLSMADDIDPGHPAEDRR
jgi:flavin reductase (DIM6/NTAB) family NADH-FMN oxidoreductase RutF